jgi:hypothetical protein
MTLVLAVAAKNIKNVMVPKSLYYSLCWLLIGLSWVSFTPDDTNKPHINKPDELISYQEKRLKERLRPGSETQEGFAVMLRFSDDKEAMDQVRSRFLSMYETEGIPCKVVWQNPKFKVFAGEFLSRPEAVLLLARVRNDFPGAMVATIKF